MLFSPQITWELHTVGLLYIEGLINIVNYIQYRRVLHVAFSLHALTMPITWTPPFHHNINELQLPGEIMTFNRGSRISVFSTLFHYESKSIYNLDLLMASNCRCFFSGTWRQPSNEAKWLNWAGWNTCRQISMSTSISYIYGKDGGAAAMGLWCLRNKALRVVVPAFKTPTAWSIVPSIVLGFFLICQWNLVDVIQTQAPCRAHGKDQGLL